MISDKDKFWYTPKEIKTKIVKAYPDPNSTEEIIRQMSL